MATSPPTLIVIGGSAGALEALAVILPGLRADHGVPIAIALHIPPTEPSLLVDVLGARCARAVREVDDKQPIERGVVFVAPPNYHLLIGDGARFALSVDEPVHFSRPSIDVLFESAADALGAGVIGVLLSGANEDGAAGLARIHRAGGRAIVQAPGSAAAPTMPHAGLAQVPAARALTPDELGAWLATLEAP